MIQRIPCTDQNDVICESKMRKKFSKQKWFGYEQLLKLKDNRKRIYDIRELISIGTILLDKFVQQSFCHIQRMKYDIIPHKTLQERFDGKRNEGRPRLNWINNINEEKKRLELEHWTWHMSEEIGDNLICIYHCIMTGVRNWIRCRCQFRTVKELLSSITMFPNLGTASPEGYVT